MGCLKDFIIFLLSGVTVKLLIHFADFIQFVHDITIEVFFLVLNENKYRFLFILAILLLIYLTIKIRKAKIKKAKAGMKFKALVRKGADFGYVAEVPALPGCVSQGETAAEALSNIQEAIALYIEDKTPKEIERLIRSQNIK